MILIAILFYLSILIFSIIMYKHDERFALTIILSSLCLIILIDCLIFVGD